MFVILFYSCPGLKTSRCYMYLFHISQLGTYRVHADMFVIEFS